MTENRSQGKEEGAYLYPNLAKAIVGSWKTKRSEHYSTAEYRLDYMLNSAVCMYLVYLVFNLT